MSNGTASNGTASNGTASNGTASNGTASNAHAVDDASESISSCISLAVGGDQMALELRRADAAALAALRERLEDGVGRGASAPGGDAPLRAAVASLLRSMDVPWAGLPDGWSVEEDATGASVYRSEVDGATVLRAKPTESAARHAERVEAGRGSLAAANEEHARKREAREAERKKAAAAAQGPTAEGSDKEAGDAADGPGKAEAVERKKKEAEARREEEAAKRAAERAAETAELKRTTMARVAAAERSEAEARSAAGVTGSLRGVARLLAELDLDKYASAFEAAGVDDERLAEIATLVDEDREGEAEGCGSSGDGAAAIDELIASVGIKGGSAVKLKRRLLDPNAGRRGGTAKGAGAKGSGGRKEGAKGSGGARGPSGAGRTNRTDGGVGPGKNSRGGGRGRG